METESVPLYFIINGAPGFSHDFEIQGCVYPGKLISRLPGKLRLLSVVLLVLFYILLLCGPFLRDKCVAFTQHSLHFDSQMAVFSY